MFNPTFLRLLGYEVVHCKIKKLDPNQPINACLFVLILNIVGFAG